MSLLIFARDNVYMIKGRVAKVFVAVSVKDQEDVTPQDRKYILFVFILHSYC